MFLAEKVLEEPLVSKKKKVSEEPLVSKKKVSEEPRLSGVSGFRVQLFRKETKARRSRSACSDM
jgi:hypothetical protein